MAITTFVWYSLQSATSCDRKQGSCKHVHCRNKDPSHYFLCTFATWFMIFLETRSQVLWIQIRNHLQRLLNCLNVFCPHWLISVVADKSTIPKPHVNKVNCDWSLYMSVEQCLCVYVIDCKKDGRRVSASFHYRKVKLKHLSMAVAILRKWRHLEPESAQ